MAAANECKTNYSHLVHIKTREVMYFVHDLLGNFDSHGDDYDDDDDVYIYIGESLTC